MDLSVALIILFILLIIILATYFIYDYIYYKNVGKKLLNINEDVINNYNELFKNYELVVDLLRQQEITEKYKKLYEREKEKTNILQSYIDYIASKKKKKR